VTRRPRGETIPEALCAEILAFAQHLTQDHAAFFTSYPQAKHSLSRLFKSKLPPLQPRGFATVSQAIRLRDELRRRDPRRSLKQIWREMYPQLIPGHADLPLPERREAQNQLRQRVYWRLSIRRRRARRRQKKLESVL
jgi:hypothetical protein